MTNPIERLAQRARGEPYFLAHVLEAHAVQAQLDDNGLAQALGCSLETLLQVRLCRAPGESAEDFRHDIETIARRFGLDPRVLANLIKKGRVAARLTQSRTTDTPGYLLAAREHEDDQEIDQEIDQEETP